MTATIKQGDTYPPLLLTCHDGSDPVNLTGALEARVRISTSPDAIPTVDAVCVIANQQDNPGEVTYEWQAGDTDTAGAYLVEVVITWPDGDQTFPADGYGRLRITDDLAETAIV